MKGVDQAVTNVKNACACLLTCGGSWVHKKSIYNPHLSCIRLLPAVHFKKWCLLINWFLRFRSLSSINCCCCSWEGRGWKIDVKMSRVIQYKNGHFSMSWEKIVSPFCHKSNKSSIIKFSLPKRRQIAIKWNAMKSQRWRGIDFKEFYEIFEVCTIIMFKWWF